MNAWSRYRGVFAADGKRLAAFPRDSEPRPIVQWDVAAGGELPNLESVAKHVHALAYSADGRTLAGITRREDECTGRWVTGIHFWEAATGKVCLRIEDSDPMMTCLDFAPDGRQLAVGSIDGTIRIFDTITGKQLRGLDGHRGEICSLHFAADGKTLGSASADTTVLLWDMTQPAAKEELAALSPAALDGYWADLRGDDAAKAYRAVWALANAPSQAVPFLRSRFKMAVPPDGKQLRRWIGELDSDEYEVRQAAQARLAGFGKLIEPAVKELLKGAFHWSCAAAWNRSPSPGPRSCRSKPLARFRPWS
jgi:hypothetical protein